MRYCYNDVYKEKGICHSVGHGPLGEGTDYLQPLIWLKEFEYCAGFLKLVRRWPCAAETGWGLMVPKNSANTRIIGLDIHLILHSRRTIGKKQNIDGIR